MARLTGVSGSQHAARTHPAPGGLRQARRKLAGRRRDGQTPSGGRQRRGWMRRRADIGRADWLRLTKRAAGDLRRGKSWDWQGGQLSFAQWCYLEDPTRFGLWLALSNRATCVATRWFRSGRQCARLRQDRPRLTGPSRADSSRQNSPPSN